MNRTQLFKNTTYKGFTLIELLVVIAIIGLLSTIIAAPIQNARKKARDSKKIAELKNVQLALDQYAEQNAGSYPVGLGYLSPNYMPLLPSFTATTSTTVAPRDMFAYSPYQISGDSLRTSFFGYHLGVHLENFSGALDNDMDCIGAETSAGLTTVQGTSTCSFFPVASGGYINSFYAGITDDQPSWNFTPGMITARVLTWDTAPTGAEFMASGGNATTSTTDFIGSDGNIATCDAVTDCVFDVTAQQ